MSDLPQALTADQPTIESHERSIHRHRHRHGPAKRFARWVKKYRSYILMVAGLLILLVMWYMIASYEPASPL